MPKFKINLYQSEVDAYEGEAERMYARANVLPAPRQDIFIVRVMAPLAGQSTIQHYTVTTRRQPLFIEESSGIVPIIDAILTAPRKEALEVELLDKI